ncbi:hypothetical protein GSI_15677 [Ganoderma sinense ZZ0214-1]|uniref:Uncharacterized protein n=1 Tax=Ganoderma sinense ZZ0214-1 TaxID=1077348 RepID=A0A2G8RNA6_9APHY|nr:hypothetical protein GSI_15677 [Ganoderma sinense ZZ0214-1]
MPNNRDDTWPTDVKNAERRSIDVDPNVLPEYTLLPTSPPPEPEYDGAPPHASPVDNPNDVTIGLGMPSTSTSTSNSNPNSNAGAGAEACQCTGTCGAETLRIVKLLYIGLLALAVPPVLLACVALAMGAVALYGCGKVLEGTGRALAVGPEAVYRAWVAKRARRFWRAVRGGERRGGCCGGSGNGEGESGRDERTREEEIGFVEGQVALDDVEAQAGQGGPISI